MAEIDVEHYPISLEEVKEKIAGKNEQNYWKKVNESREEIVSVGGDIPAVQGTSCHNLPIRRHEKC